MGIFAFFRCPEQLCGLWPEPPANWQIGRLARCYYPFTLAYPDNSPTLLLCYSVTVYGERDSPAAPWLPAGNKRTLCPDLVAFLCDCRCLQSRLHRVTADVYHNTVHTFPYGLVLGLGRLFPCHTYSANRDITGQGQADRQAGRQAGRRTCPSNHTSGRSQPNVRCWIPSPHTHPCLVMYIHMYSVLRRQRSVGRCIHTHCPSWCVWGAVGAEIDPLGSRPLCSINLL